MSREARLGLVLGINLVMVIALVVSFHAIKLLRKVALGPPSLAAS